MNNKLLNIFKNKKNIFNRKNIFIGAGVFLVVFFIVLASFNSGKLLANLSSNETPPDSDFKDINFYKCVVDRYNITHSSSKKAYTDVLTNEELESITFLDCDDKNIEDASGIEKLTKLTNLHLISNNLTKVDLGKNTLLKELYLGKNNLEEVNLEHNINLTTLDVSYNKLKDIDLTKNILLEGLILYYNELKNIDLSNNTNLYAIYLDNNNIETVDLSNNTKLTNLYLSDNTALTSLNLENNNNLTTLTIDNTKLIEDIPTLLPGEEYEFKTGLVLPSGSEVEYSISDSSIAKLENKTITALKEGTTDLRMSTSFDNKYVTASINVVKAKITSDKYIIDDNNNILYTKSDKDIETIKSNISTNIGEIVIENDILKIIDKNRTILEYKIINYDINYPIISDTINLTNNKLNKDNIVVNNGSYEIKDNNLYIKYDDEIIDTYKLSSYTLNDYNIILDNDKKYIYLKNTSFNKDKLSLINCEAVVDNNTLKIMYNDNVLDTIYLLNVSIKDNKYNFDNIIYVGTDEFSVNNFEYNNCIIEDMGNYKYKISIGENTLDVISVIKINTVDSQIKDGIKNGYIYLGSKDFSSLSDFNIVNGYSKIDNDYLIIYSSKDEKEELAKFKLLTISSNKYNLLESHYEDDNSYYIYTDYLDVDKIKLSDELEIRYSNGTYEIKLKSSDIIFERIYKVYITEKKNSYKIIEDKIYFGMIKEEKLPTALEVKNGSSKKNDDYYEIYDDKGTFVKKYKILALIIDKDFSSDSYDYAFINDSLFLGTEAFDLFMISDKINVSISYTSYDNLLKVYYNEELINTIKIINLYMPDKYKYYSISESLIYLNTDEFTYDMVNVITNKDQIDKNKINIINGKIVSRTIVGHNEIKFQTFEIFSSEYDDENMTDDISEKYAVKDNSAMVNVSSDKYDLSKNYIYIGANKFENDISLKMFGLTIKEIDDSWFEITNDSVKLLFDRGDLQKLTLNEWKLVSISSDKYDLSNSEIKLKDDETFDIDSINVINGKKEFKNNTLTIKYENDVLQEFKITGGKKTELKTEKTNIIESIINKFVKKDSKTTKNKKTNKTNKTKLSISTTNQKDTISKTKSTTTVIKTSKNDALTNENNSNASLSRNCNILYLLIILFQIIYIFILIRMIKKIKRKNS